MAGATVFPFKAGESRGTSLLHHGTGLRMAMYATTISRQNLRGKQFQVVTDPLGLRRLLTMAEPRMRVAEGTVAIESLHFTVTHASDDGSLMPAPNASFSDASDCNITLSRRYFQVIGYAGEGGNRISPRRVCGARRWTM